MKFSIETVSIVRNKGDVATCKSHKPIEPVVDMIRVKGGVCCNENTYTINGNEFYKLGIKHLCKTNNVEFQDNLKIDCITYDKSVNNDSHFKLNREIAHDGTFLFQYEQLINMFYELLTKQTPPVKGFDLMNYSYHIGDVTVYNTYNIETQKHFPMMKQRFELPIKLVRRDN